MVLIHTFTPSAATIPIRHATDRAFDVPSSANGRVSDDFGEGKDMTYQIDAAVIDSSIIVEEEV